MGLSIHKAVLRCECFTESQTSPGQIRHPTPRQQLPAPQSPPLPELLCCPQACRCIGSFLLLITTPTSLHLGSTFCSRAWTSGYSQSALQSPARAATNAPGAKTALVHGAQGYSASLCQAEQLRMQKCFQAKQLRPNKQTKTPLMEALLRLGHQKSALSKCF